MGWIVAALLLGLIPGLIARSRGETFFNWWLFGVFMFILALPMAIMTTGKKCPACKTRINRQATLCPACRSPQPLERGMRTILGTLDPPLAEGDDTHS